MQNKNVVHQIKLLYWVTLANFIAQIPYFFKQYYHGSSDLLKLFNIPLLLVLAVFLTAYYLLLRQRKAGYWLMIFFLFMEFAFYFSNVIFSYFGGLGLFFQIMNPDCVLKSVFIIGYLNLFASGYFLFLLLSKKHIFIP